MDFQCEDILKHVQYAFAEDLRLSQVFPKTIHLHYQEQKVISAHLDDLEMLFV
ncbi:hypothetical protein D3C76_874320 [compost metagenome]